MTTDLKISQSSSGMWDLSLDDSGDLANGDFFDSSLYYSLLGERRAQPSEVSLPFQRRGWVGSVGREFENGSKIWLFSQERLTRTVLNGIQDAALDSLKWLVEDGFLKNVEAQAFLKDSQVQLQITLIRFDAVTETRLFTLWQNTGAA